MFKRSRSMLLASAFLVIAAGSRTLQAADDPIFIKAKEAFDSIGKGNPDPTPPLVIVTSGDPQIVTPAAPSMVKPADSQTVKPAESPIATVSGKACRDGKCAAQTEDSPKQAEAKSCCSCFKKIGHWFSFDATTTSCACFARPSPYYPSVYAWFPLVPGMTCATAGGCAPRCGQLVAGKHFDNPLPKPEMPKIAKTDKPLVPGSSTVMATNDDSTAPLPVNYKSLPVAPNSR